MPALVTGRLLAMAAVSLNELYPGRFLLGLGTSTRAVIEGGNTLSR